MLKKSPNPPIPQSPNPPIPQSPESPIQWNTIKALGRDKIADKHTYRQTDRQINSMNDQALGPGRLKNQSITQN